MNSFSVIRYGLLLSSFLLYAQSGKAWQPSDALWTDVPESAFVRKDMDRRIIPEKYRTLALDFENMKAALSHAPDRLSPQAAHSPVVITLPMPDGSLERFRVVEASVMHPDLQHRYPGIRSYAAQGLSDPTAYARLGYSHKGFHAMILSARHSAVFIDPYAASQTTYYISYYKKDYLRTDAFDFSCKTDQLATDEAFQTGDAPLVQSLVQGDCSLRKYRLALACTGEYAQYHGGTKPDVMAEYNVAMTRVNGIYERELTVTMELVPNTDTLIFLFAATDPYTNNSGGQMLGENQVTCDNLIGPANYDIGHVFSTGGGGIAGLGVVCLNNQKARGVTGLGNPVGDPFYVDYVAHEIGHQFGGNHTFNNSCGGNRNNATAVEPGSGSTIMSYAGICAPNVQNNADDYFHAVNIEEMTSFIEAGAGGTCPTVLSPDNTPPTVNVPAAGYILPISTPFMLTATATDADTEDMLTYCWEQMDHEIVTQPPLPTNAGGPAFRTLPPTSNPTRYFPALGALVNNQTPTWEVLPSVSRQMNFRVTVRDNHLGAGCTDAEDVQLTFTDQAGPFLVTYPNTTETWFVGELRTITWDVANTDQAPVACSEVDILLSLDGGYTYPVVLAQNAANTGSYTLTVPQQVTPAARIMVKCADNIFFDISNQNIAIELPPDPTFFLGILPNTVEACPGDTLSLQIVVTGVSGFDEAVSLSMSGLPASATISFSQNEVVPPATLTATITGLTPDDAGSWTLTCTGQSPAITQTADATLVLYGGPPPATTPIAPTDGAQEIPTTTTLSWNDVAQANTYRIQLDHSPAFDSPMLNEWTTQTASLALTELDEHTVYYWRIQAVNICDQAPWSAPAAFQTGMSDCLLYTAADLPIPIPPTDTGSYTSTIHVPDTFLITSVRMPTLRITHTWVGDLSAQLTSPDGTVITLFHRPGVPASTFGCSNGNVDVSFADDAPASANALENMCNGSSPAITGNFQPLDSFTNFIGSNAAGNWIITITDHYNEDGGALTDWSLELCRTVMPTPTPQLTISPLVVPAGGTATISPTHLMPDTPTDNHYTLLSPPAHGTIYVNGEPAGLGDSFRQSDLSDGTVMYVHDGGPSAADTVWLDLVGPSGGWLHDLALPIIILQNTLSADAQIQHVSCYGAQDGQIAIILAGGYGPFAYSLDGGMAQTDSIFSSLPAGNYQVVVTDVYGFADTIQAIIEQPAPLIPQATITGDSIVGNATGGTPPYTYSLDGQNFQAEPTFADLPDGVYLLVVVDAQGCTAQQQLIVATQALIAAATLENDITCNGDDDATISVMAAGGTPPYTYSLDGQNFQTEPTFADLPEGTYTITVRDVAGTTTQTNSVTVTNPPVLVATATVSGYTLTAAATGGTPPYTYSLDGQNFQSSAAFLPGNGTWAVTVMDSHGCTATAQATVDVAPLAVSATVTDEIACFGANQGAITASADGGVAPYEYSLDGQNWQNEPLFDGLPAGTYAVQVRDAGGVIAISEPLVLDEPAPIAVTAVAANHQITITASGGTPPYTYSLNDGPAQPEPLFDDIDTSGTYTITVTDALGCTTTLTLEVSVVEAANITFNAPACAGEPVQMVVTHVEGGTPPYEYSLDGQNWQDAPSLEDVVSGTFYVYVRDANGFTWQSPPFVVDLIPLVIEAAVNGNTVTLSATGGVPPYTWSIDGTTFEDVAVFEDLPNGTYTGYVQDANDCVKQVTFEINVVQGATLALTHISCTGGADGEIEITAVQGGAAPYLYSLDGQNWQSEPIFDDLAAATYQLYIQDASGFVHQMEVTLTEPSPLTLEVTTADDELTAHAAGGTPPYQFSLDGGITWQADSTFSNLMPGTYTVLVRDFNGCLAFEEVQLTPNAATETAPLPFTLWPNPTTGILYLRLPEAGAATVELFDLTGRHLWRQSWTIPAPDEVQPIDMGDVPAGSYTLRIVMNNRVGIHPVIVVR